LASAYRAIAVLFDSSGSDSARGIGDDEYNDESGERLVTAVILPRMSRV
jgi:hypothetical protein